MRLKLKWWHIGLLIALLVACLAPLASTSPDGLERVAEDKGFLDRALDAPYRVIADYLFPGIHNEALATVVSGLIGVLVLFCLGYGIAWLLRARRRGPA